jgi:hypothetical protein
MNVSPENKAIAKHVAKAFGGVPRVNAYLHESEPLTVDILRCEDRPCDGVTSYSTIGLSDWPMFKEGKEFPARLEIAGACATANGSFGNILASTAFCVMRTGCLCHPGSVMLDYVREYYERTTVPHLYFTAPFLWEDALKTLDCGSKKASWLLIVPISNAECDYLRDRGDDALENLFEKHQIDIFDLRRPSVV